ncbi:hypothetical protein ACQ3G7_18620 [Kosakonia oryzendophytica]|uniref:hypothetical protein n=1 Tax=Kosakonia oryzendophytica TaxID=1005665 RepID=UPI003D328C23
MNKLLEEFFSIEGILNRKARDFLLTVQQEGISWSLYEKQEMVINEYHYNVQRLIIKYHPDWELLICSDDAETRLVTLKVVRDGFLDLSSSANFVKNLIYSFIIGNEEEKKVAKDLIIYRGWLIHYTEMIKAIIADFHSQDLDYYSYKDIGDFLVLINAHDLLIRHVNIGMRNVDEEVVELAEQYSATL